MYIVYIFVLFFNNICILSLKLYIYLVFWFKIKESDGGRIIKEKYLFYIYFVKKLKLIYFNKFLVKLFYCVKVLILLYWINYSV